MAEESSMGPRNPHGQASPATCVEQAASTDTNGTPSSSKPSSEVEEWKVPEPDDIFTGLQAEFDRKTREDAQDKLDEAVMEEYKKSMELHKSTLDTLLVYAGLFSAILTAFNVESYALLKPDPLVSTIAAIRLEMSGQQLAQLRERPGFDAPRYVVWVNILWFSSLIISLSSATIALMVMQWLYESNESVALGHSHLAARQVQYRLVSLYRWRVDFILSLVPALLQLSLIAFLIGLVVLLWNIHTVVAAVSSALIGTLFVFLVVVTVLPAFQWDCFYRSRQADLLYTLYCAIRNGAISLLTRCSALCAKRAGGRNHSGLRIWLWRILRRCCEHFSRQPRPRTWEAQEWHNIEKQSDLLDAGIAATAYHSTLDPTYLDRLRATLSGQSGLPLFLCVLSLDQLLGQMDTETDRNRKYFRGLPRSTSASALVQTVLRQLLAIDRRDGGYVPWYALGWEPAVQALFNTCLKTLPGDSPPFDEALLKIAFWISLETTSPENTGSVLRYLQSAIDVDSFTSSSDYPTVYHVMSAAVQWIERHKDWIAARHLARTPDVSMLAPAIIAHALLSVASGRTIVPDSQRQQFQKLCDRGREAFRALPVLLPTADDMVRDRDICEKLAHALSLLLCPLLALLRPADESYPVDALTLADEGVVDALESAWATARSVLGLPALAEGVQPPAAAPKAVLPRLRALQRDVGRLFNTFGQGPLAPPTIDEIAS